MGDERWNDVCLHRERLLRIAVPRCESREDAEDVVHEAMLRCVGFAELDSERLGQFLTSVTIRLCVDLHRSRERRERALRRLEPEPDVLHDPEEVICRASEIRRLTDHLRRLPRRQRSVLLDRAHGLTVPQIARRHGMTYKATESALSRARATLRATLVVAGALVAGLRRLARGPAVAIPALALAFVAGAIVVATRPPSDGSAWAASAPVPGLRPVPPRPAAPRLPGSPPARRSVDSPRPTPSPRGDIVDVEHPGGGRLRVYDNGTELDKAVGCKDRARVWVEADPTADTPKVDGAIECGKPGSRPVSEQHPA